MASLQEWCTGGRGRESGDYARSCATQPKMGCPAPATFTHAHCGRRNGLHCTFPGAWAPRRHQETVTKCGAPCYRRTLFLGTPATYTTPPAITRAVAAEARKMVCIADADTHIHTTTRTSAPYVHSSAAAAAGRRASTAARRRDTTPPAVPGRRPPGASDRGSCRSCSSRRPDIQPRPAPHGARCRRALPADRARTSPRRWCNREGARTDRTRWAGREFAKLPRAFANSKTDVTLWHAVVWVVDNREFARPCARAGGGWRQGQ